ncbi:ABC transporter ATP-binding protein [Flavisolibacter ginsenosidimutans]|uniref:ABC transporter ATP-binding protein n=1 Tax=Flavisolibacter ginsenosidimutans TaxID=661481 RepID=A0A5B8UME5_9BACT|nr:ABC transporter ATP-binding protein [Flavisolibacter ginsenosidimutans]QEC57847.1 ABC transporter ATP-binding protein [Flavisolibacter ginsenosidimutans]
MKKYARVFKYLSHYKGEAFLYILFILLSIVFSLISLGMLLPFLEMIFNGAKGTGLLNNSDNALVNFIRHTLTESITTRGNVPTLALICVLIIVSIFFKNLFLYLAYYVLNPLKNNIVNRLRTELYEKVLHLPIGFFTEKRKGDIISRITNDVGEVEGSVVGTLEGWVRDPLTILFTLGTLFVISYQLTLFVLACIPIVAFVIGRITRSLKKGSSEMATLNAESLSVLDETLGGLRVIKAFNSEPFLRDRFFGINHRLVTVKNKLGFRRDLASPASELMGVVIFTAILFFGGQLVLNSTLSLTGSLFIVYLGLFYQLINPTKTLSGSFSNMARGTAAIERIEEILRTQSAIDDNPNGKKLDAFEDCIELRNVNFSYDGVPILKNINLKVPKGKTVALVGSSGAGKSTLADLVPRFHDVSGGELLVDGVNIKDYSLRSVREQISIVTQEPILFNDSIENNIRLGKQEASQSEIEDASKVANAYNFITKKEAGFNTNIGDRGTKLSGGERQRLTIARAIVKNPPILILDEATSSLDTESERLVQDAINNMMQNRTSIVIAHRLSTIRHADEIIVLQKGEIVERGTHEELLQKQGYYYRLVQMQEVK